MKVTFIHHSSFLVELERLTLLFDYFQGTLPEPNSSKPLVVFSSHRHGDHFSKEIFRLKDSMPVVRYVLSDDIPKTAVPADCRSCTSFIGPRAVLELEPAPGVLLSIRTLASNDLGVAFLLETDGRKLYFAGDLNNWWWDGDDEDRQLAALYHAELETIRGQRFDAAFIPLDPRLKGWHLGIWDFLSYADAAAVFPMHMWNDFQMVSRFLQMPESGAYAHKIVPIVRDGQSFEFP